MAPSGELVTPASYFGDDVTNDQVTSWAVAANSQTAVNALLGVGTGDSIETWLNEDRPIEIVSASQPEVLIAEGNKTNGENWCGTDFTDASLSNSNAPPAGNWDSIAEAPIPSGVYYSSASSDDEVAVLQTSNPPQEYDFWLFGEGGTSSGSGNQTFPGKVLDPFYSSGSPNPDALVYGFGDGGQLTPTNNPPVFTQVGCGVSASGLSIVATDISEQDIYDAAHFPAQTGGGIDHALSLEVPWNLCDGFAWPANRARLHRAGHDARRRAVLPHRLPSGLHSPPEQRCPAHRVHGLLRPGPLRGHRDGPQHRGSRRSHLRGRGPGRLDDAGPLWR